MKDALARERRPPVVVHGGVVGGQTDAVDRKVCGDLPDRRGQGVKGGTTRSGELVGGPISDVDGVQVDDRAVPWFRVPSAAEPGYAALGKFGAPNGKVLKPHPRREIPAATVEEGVSAVA